MAKLFLRHKEDGEIMSYSEKLAKHPKLEVVTEEEAYPERFMPLAVLGRESKLDLSVPDAIANPPPYIDPELAADAGRDFGGRNATKATVPTGLAGLIEGI